jgi:mRNA interferase YafQ
MKSKYTVEYKKKCKKQIKKKQKSGADMQLFETVVTMLANGETLPPKYSDHKLHGKMSHLRECHIQPDWLLVYQIIDDKLILELTATGTHEETLM